MPDLPDASVPTSSLLRADRDIVFYDGACALCHGTVRFFLRRDREGNRFVFAPLGGETFVRALGGGHLEDLPDSVLVRTADGRLLTLSAAVAYLLGRLGGPWAAAGRLVGFLPSLLTDSAYSFVARIRRTLFGSPAGSCPVPSGPDRERFLP